jgi:lysophospholipase L1-like esterase
MKKLLLFISLSCYTVAINAQSWAILPQKTYSASDSSLVWNDATKRFNRTILPIFARKSYVDSIVSGGGSGTVTNVSSANSDASVSNPTTTPVITINSAPKLTNARTIGMTGDVSWTSASFDGSANVTGTSTISPTTGTVNFVKSGSPTFTGTPVLATPDATSVNLTGTAGNGFIAYRNQSASPTRISYGINGAKLFLNSSGVRAVQARLGDGIKDYNDNDFEQQVNSIYYDIFDRSNIGSNYVAVGSPTYSIVSNKLNLSNGASNFSKLLKIGSETLIEDVYITMIINDVNTDGQGVALGVYDGGTSQIVASFDMNTAGNRGQVVIGTLNSSTNTLTARATSTVNLSYTNTDRIKLEFRRMKYGFYMTATNLTNTSILPTVTFLEAGTSAGSYLISKPYFQSLYALGGDIDIESIEIGSKSQKKAKICFIGDSNTSGYYASTPVNRFASILDANTKEVVSVYAQQSATCTNINNDKSYLLDMTAEKALCIIHIGTNDALQTVSAATYQTNLNAVVNFLLQNGRIPVICLPIPFATGGTNYSTQNARLDTYVANINTDWAGRVLIVDTKTAFGGSSGNPLVYTSDQIHMNDEGNRLFANTVRAATTKLITYNFNPFFSNNAQNLVLYQNDNAAITSISITNNAGTASAAAAVDAISGTATTRIYTYSQTHATRPSASNILSFTGDMWYTTVGNKTHNWSINNSANASMSLNTTANLTLSQSVTGDMGYNATNGSNTASSRSVLNFTTGGAGAGIFHYSPNNTTAGLASALLMYNNNGNNVYANLSGTHQFLIGGFNPTGTQKKMELTSTALTLGTSISLIGATSQDVFNTVSTTINAFGAATAATIFGTSTAATTFNIGNNATATATTKALNIGTGGASGSITNITLGSATAGATGTVISNVPVRLKGYTVATLPTGVVGNCAYVTDALAPTYNTTVVGGGAVTIKVFYNGTNWVCN